MTDPTPDRQPLPSAFRAVFVLRVSMLFVGLGANILILAGLVDVIPGAVVFGGAVLVYTVATLTVWRCPSCGKFPGNAVMPDICERCQKPIFGHDAELPARKTAGWTAIRLRYIVGGRFVYGLILLAFFALSGSWPADQPLAFWGAALGLISGGVWLEWRWWRCPSCGGYLRKGLWPGSTCRKCGSALRY